MFSRMDICRLLSGLVVLLCGGSLPSEGLAQKVNVGVVTGVSLSDDFRPAVVTTLGGDTLHVSNASEWFAVGPAIELVLPKHLSMEVDAIRRRIRSKQLTVYGQPVEFPNGVVIRSYGPVVAEDFAWQFSALGKYTVANRTVKPFVEAGLSFLPRENRDQTGVTAGSGIELALWNLSLSPALRYTRWLNNDSFGGVNDQFQFIARVHEKSESVRPRAFGRQLTLGFIAGFGLTKLLRNHLEPAIGFASTSDAHTPVGGFFVKVPVRNHFSLEVDGLYRPTHTIDQKILPDGSLRNSTRSAFLTWQVPVLATYEVPIARLTPVIELGPSFRVIAHTDSNQHSHHGITAGVGVAARMSSFAISPKIRYTRWALDRDRFGREPFDATRPNQLELVIAFSF